MPKMEKLVVGYWCIYKMHLEYGGPEEGGWHYEAGEMVACLPAERRAILNFPSEEFEYEPTVDQYLEDEQSCAILGLLKAHVTTVLGGEIGGDAFRSVAPKKDTYWVMWCEQPDRYFPKERPRYE